MEKMNGIFTSRTTLLSSIPFCRLEGVEFIYNKHKQLTMTADGHLQPPDMCNVEQLFTKYGWGTPRGP